MPESKLLNSMSVAFKVGLCHGLREPRTQRIRAFIWAKQIFVRSQFIATPGGIPFLSESCSEMVFRKLCVSRLHPPYSLKTFGVNKACSTCTHRWLYWCFFYRSFLVKAGFRLWFECVLAYGLKTLTSKNSISHLTQNHLAATSRRASSAILDPHGKISPVKGVRLEHHKQLHLTGWQIYLAARHGVGE